MYQEYIRRLYTVNLALREGEKLLLLTDDEKPYLVDLMEEFYEVALDITPHVEKVIYPSLKGHGKEPPAEVWEKTFSKKAVEVLKEKGLLDRVLNKEPYSEDEVIDILLSYSQGTPDVVVAFAHYSTTHTFYRKVLTNHFGTRYASMPLFEPQMFLGPMNVDWDYVAKLSTDLAEILSEAEWAEVVAEGTKIEFSLSGRKAIADTGLFHQKGQYGNLPAGEAFIAPLETSAFGSLTVFYGPDRPLERPITLRFRNGQVEEIEGIEPYRDFLEDVFKQYEGARFIAEFGVGTNPGARRPDNVLEAEKILGTIHIAIGDNHSFGGVNKVPFHTDYVVFEPYVVVGGKGWHTKLLEKGLLRV
ncbi:aminopeptidase [Thermocrinis minervae]|uniref:Leucyl aminopeptidase (Aminopeptidase T) n=1 Tax=Thermocrinis minervae TaxID=381751 RepID=A0A1M6QVV6_9AQUI|nr:aminopeptidase [Thermocrinis minervae]SHK24197.1 Leucyl aminopeptidase (aminopeptidase T) [Thermocrinis minervae]